jgi:cobaltochelatase CobS
MEIDGTPDPIEHALKVMQDALAVQKRQREQVSVESIRRIVKECIAEDGALKIEVTRWGGEVYKIPGLCHKTVPTLKDYVSIGEHVYLYGPHGAGKSHAAEQIAKALDLPYYLYSGTPQSPKSDIVGYLDATRELARTPFLEAFEHGGLFCWEELDSTATSLHTLINIALSSKMMAFPHGLIRQHKNFRMVACGNTDGSGANPAYPERRQFDQSFGDRFTYIKWEYDEKLEDRICAAIHPDGEKWASWVQAVRKWAKANYPSFTPSPRVSIRIATFLHLDGPVEKRLDAACWHGNEDLAKKAIANNPLPN